MQRIGNLPKFYQQMLYSLNECKLGNIENKLSCSILQQPIWNNCNFMYKGNSLGFLKLDNMWNYTCQNLLNEEGILKSLSDFSNCIKYKSNWICEFKI